MAIAQRTWTPLWRILYRIVEQVQDSGAQVFLDGAYMQSHRAGDWCEFDGRGRQMVTLQGNSDAVGHQRGEFQQGAVLVATALAQLASLQHLLNRRQQAVGIGQHDLVELLPLLLGDSAALQRLAVQPDGGDGGF